MAALSISPVADKPHFRITCPEPLGGSLVFRVPEFVKAPDGASTYGPSNVAWEHVVEGTHLRYEWAEPDAVKRKWATDFRGEVRTAEDEVAFDVTMRNTGDAPQPWGVFLFCLQAGGCRGFQDYDGVRTFVRLNDRWVTVNQMQNGVFEEHRMCVYPVGADGVAHNLMAKVSSDRQWVLAVAIDRPGWVSCNHQLWPSCIHANPVWGDPPPDPGPRTPGCPIAPGVSRTAHGKVYVFRGDLDALYDRYNSDFHGA